MSLLIETRSEDALSRWRRFTEAAGRADRPERSAMLAQARALLPSRNGRAAIEAAHRSGVSDLLALTYAQFGPQVQLSGRLEIDATIHRALWLYSIRYNTEPSGGAKALMLHHALLKDDPDLLDTIPGMDWGGLDLALANRPDILQMRIGPRLAPRMAELLDDMRRHENPLKPTLFFSVQILPRLWKDIASGQCSLKSGVLAALTCTVLPGPDRRAAAKTFPALDRLFYLMRTKPSALSGHDRVLQAWLRRKGTTQNILELPPDVPGQTLQDTLRLHAR